MLDNIVYDTQKKYVEGYTESILDWVKTLLSFIPSESRIYIAQHSPNICPGERYTLNSRKMLDILKGRKADFISGHTHISYNLIVTPEIMEHNVAASCGSWWVTGHCTDGTPGGYKIFENDSRGLTWYYKSIGHDRGYQIETFNLGQSIRHPNAVLANVWDYDPEWKVEWYQDGKYMGEMEQAEDMSPEYIREIHSVYTDRGKEIPGYKQPDWSDHYFMAVPDVYAKEVKICVTDRYGNTYESVENLRDFTDVQAHRGGAGLMPENTISSMKNAIDLGVNTLELDLQISADKQVVVSHDAYFHPRYATRPDGSTVRPEDPKEYIYTMPYSEVAKYDTGLRQSEVWPEKANIAEHKPLADELIGFVEKYTADNGLTPMRYNIEIKSKAGKTEGVNWPEYREFVDRCAELLLSKGLGDRLVVQSFDVRALNYMHEKYPQLVLSYLVDAKEPDFDKYMSLINFTPVWLSPHYTIVDEELCRKCSEKGIKLVPWTVDTPEDIQRMIDLKVEAIISNYPDRLLKATRGYIHPDK